MKSARLVALVVALVAVTTVTSPAVASWLGALGFSFRFSRIYNRVFEVLLVVVLALGWRRLDLGGPAQWGFRRDRWWQDLAIGLAIGVAGLSVGLLVAWAAGGLVPELRYAVPKTVRKATLGMLGAGIVSVGEEALFRGVLMRRFVLDFGPRAGVVVTTVVYAVVHALRGGGKVMTSGAFAGWERTSSLFAPLADPLVWPGVAGLFVLGLLLATVRRRTGSLWAAIGIHAAWVGVFRVGRLLFEIRRRPAWLVGPGWPPLVGGAAGAIALVSTALLLRLWLRQRARGHG